MTAENVENKGLSKETITAITKELTILREWTSSWGTPSNLITPENFPNISKHSPESFEIFVNLSNNDLEIESKRLKIKTEFPEIWNWPDEKERAYLMSAAHLGLGKEALVRLKEEYEQRIKPGKNIGFGL